MAVVPNDSCRFGLRQTFDLLVTLGQTIHVVVELRQMIHVVMALHQTIHLAVAIYHMIHLSLAMVPNNSCRFGLRQTIDLGVTLR